MEDQSGNDLVYVFRDAVYEGSLENIQELLDAGVPVNTRDGENSTALMWAADEGREDVAALLLTRNADVNAQDCAGWTPLLLAANTNRLEIVRLLLSQGADMTAQTNTGMTVDTIADRNGNSSLRCLLGEHRHRPSEA